MQHFALERRFDGRDMHDVDIRAEPDQHRADETRSEVEKECTPEDALDGAVVGLARLGDMIFGRHRNAEIKHAEITDQRPHQVDDTVALDPHAMNQGPASQLAVNAGTLQRTGDARLSARNGCLPEGQTNYTPE